MLIADVSNNNGVLNWQVAATTPRLVGVYVKHGEGRGWEDERAEYNGHNARAHGLAIGYYHFARPDLGDPEPEADHLIRRLATLPPATLPPALDLEHEGHAGAHDAVEWARRFNRRVHARIGVWPIFYSYPAFIVGMAPVTPIGGGLWLAATGPNDGKEHAVMPPAPWRNILLHQFTSVGRLNGHEGNIDLSAPSARFASVIRRNF